jgi:hypothetical protein
MAAKDMGTQKYGKPPYSPGTAKGKTETKRNWNTADKDKK